MKINKDLGCNYDVVIHYLGINRNKRLLQYVIKRDNNG